MRTEIGPALIDMPALLFGHGHIDPNADHGGTGPGALTGDLDQDTGQLGPLQVDIIGPFQAGTLDPQLPQGTHQGNAHYQAEAGQG